MDCIAILAQAGENANSGGQTRFVFDIEKLWSSIQNLGPVEAFVFISFGVVWLFYGWRVFKILVVITFALLGLALGRFACEIIAGADDSDKLIASVIGMGVLASLSVPLMRWAVSVLGAMAGAIFTAGIWYACLGQQFLWAGALIGMVAGGMISFIVFRVAVILFTSMGGGALIMTGSLAVIYKYGQVQTGMNDLILHEKWVLPVAVMVPMLVGLIAQHKFVKTSKDWEI